MAIDLARYSAVRAAPQVVFDQLAEPGVAERARFRVPTPARDGWSTVTWGAFGAMIRAVALGLRQRGFEPGQRAAIYGQNSVEWAAVALGIQAAGGVLVPVYPSVPEAGLRDVLDRSGARVVFANGDSALRTASRACEAEKADPLRCRAIGWNVADDAFADLLGAGTDRHRAAPELLDEMLAAIDLNQPGLMLFTSGTSGPPKGVPLSHNAVGVNARDWLTCFAPAVTEGDVDLLWLPMSHIFGFGELCLGNALGWTTWMSTPATVMADLPIVRPHVLMSVPSIWEKLDQAPDLDAATGGRLRFCLSGGAGLKIAVKERLHAQGLTVYEGYGLTEASPTLTLNRPGAIRFDTVGQPLPSLELKLADDGEILARGDSIFGGYHDDPESTAAAFTADGWLKTGDVGRFTDDGFLQIIDRKKDILVTRGGKNIAPANIERAFADEPTISHVVVYGDGHKYLVAGVWPADGANPEAVSDAVSRVNAGLMRVETIKKFKMFDDPLTIEGGLLTPTQKVKRKAVYARFGAALETLYGPGE